MIAPLQERLETNFRAFGEGNTRAYDSLYATDVELQNGANQQLTGAAQNVAFPEDLRPKPRPTTHIKLAAPGADGIVELPKSRFRIAADSTASSSEAVHARDSIRLRSTALSELSTAQFQGITTPAIDKIVSRKGETR